VRLAEAAASRSTAWASSSGVAPGSSLAMESCRTAWKTASSATLAMAFVPTSPQRRRYSAYRGSARMGAWPALSWMMSGAGV
jgi:hypothetical protein